jgi:hypothetical protein
VKTESLKVPLSFESDEQLQREREKLERLVQESEEKAKELRARARQCNRAAWGFRRSLEKITKQQFRKDYE